MNKFLALDTTGGYLTVIAANGGAVHTVFEEDCAMQHSVRLMGAVEEALAAVRLAPQDCDFFCAVTGPGSFTGIRIGIAAVKGLAAAAGRPMLGRTSLQVLAYNARGKALAAVPAGRGNYYVCGFAEDKSVCFAPACVGEEELAALSREYPLYAYAPLPLPYVQADPAAGLLSAVRAAKEGEFGTPAAFYLRRSQAEEERLRRSRAEEERPRRGGGA